LHQLTAKGEERTNKGLHQKTLVISFSQVTPHPKPLDTNHLTLLQENALPHPCDWIAVRSKRGITLEIYDQLCMSKIGDLS
jgi:hypothetical protein